MQEITVKFSLEDVQMTPHDVCIVIILPKRQTVVQLVPSPKTFSSRILSLHVCCTKLLESFFLHYCVTCTGMWQITFGSFGGGGGWRSRMFSKMKVFSFSEVFAFCLIACKWQTMSLCVSMWCKESGNDFAAPLCKRISQRNCQRAVGEAAGKEKEL